MRIKASRLPALLEALRTGNTRNAAAALAGIGHGTLYRWLEDPTIREQAEAAENEAEGYYLARVHEASADPKNWAAAAWWLERRRHEHYGRRDRVEMQIDVRREAERIAAADGLDADAILAEAERILGR